MLQQEVFFEQRSGSARVDVLKTYDQKFAHEAFSNLDEAAQAHLWTALRLEEIYEPADLPARDSADVQDFLWEELLSAARESGNLLSFFVVNSDTGGSKASIYVCPDWPSAQAFALEQLAILQ